ncbi:MAG: tetratricopeptide repeat protein [Planctomycetes bacterium]|nr:tetratricopeptide repeat protein [Planctomycetota bacterium]
MHETETQPDHEVVIEARGVPGPPGRVALVLRDQCAHRAEREFVVDLARHLPGCELDWAGFLDRYVSHRSSPAERRAFGEDLFRALTDVDEFAYVWQSILGASARRPYRLVVLLHPGSEAFARLPLELLRDARGELCAVPGASLIRTLPDATPRDAVIGASPRVLLAWAMPKDLPVFDLTPHEAALRAVHGERLTVLRHASRAALGAALADARREGRAYGVVQIVAHGSGASGDARLALENERGLTESVPARLLAATLRGFDVELVALCSCQSGIGFAGLGQTLLAEDGAAIPCVVACQADLPVAGSATLLARFHRLLLETQDPAVALGRARREAYDQSEAWSVPVLLARPGLREALAAPLFGIPPRVVSWQPRDALVGELLSALRARQIVTACGIPGVGKTELCFEVARQLLAQGAVARVLCMHVQSGMQVGLLRTMLAAALGQPALSSPAQLAGLLAGEHEVLIVLDNLEDLLGSSDSARELVELMDTVTERTRNARFLSSSRWPIGAPAESVVPVGPLARSSGAALLALELAQAGLDPKAWTADHAHWSALLDALRGQARAIRLLAARWGELHLDARAALTELREALSTSQLDWSLLGSQVAFERLDESARADLRVLAAAFTLALQHLGERAPDALDALRRLLLFPAGLPERTAMLVAGGLHGVGLQRLYERRLVDWRGGRVHVPVLLQQGSFVAAADGSARRGAFGAAILGLREHCGACSRQWALGDGRAALSRWLAEEASLLDIATEVCARPGEDELAAFTELAPSSCLLLDFADRRLSALRVAETGVALARARGDHSAEASNLHRLAIARTRVGDRVGASEALGESLALELELGNRPGEALCRLARSEQLRYAGEIDAARREAEHSRAIYQELRDANGVGSCEKALGEICMRIDDLDGAVAHFERAARRHERDASGLDLANDLRALGHACALRGDAERGLGPLREALGIYRRLDERTGVAKCHHGLATLAMLRQDFEAAVIEFRRSLALFRSVGDQDGVANALLALGDALLGANRHPEAEQAFRDALPIYLALEAPLGVANCRAAIAERHLARSEFAAARELLEQSLPIFRKVRDRRGEARCLRFLGEAQWQARSLDAAENCFAAAIEQFAARNDELELAICRLRRGSLALERRRPREAFEQLLASVPVLEAQRRPFDAMTGWMGAAIAARAAGHVDHGLLASEMSLALARRLEHRRSELGILELQRSTFLRTDDAEAEFAALLCALRVEAALGEATLAERFAAPLSANRGLLAERWSDFDANAESIRRNGIVAAVQRIRAAGGDPLRLPQG